MNKRSAYYVLNCLIIALLVIMSSCGNSSASASEEESAAAPIGFMGTHVRDQAGMMTDQEAIELEGMLGKFEQESGIQYLALTVETLNGKSIDEVGLEKARELGVGNSGVNNGCMVLISKKERKVKIDVGYGLEWEVPDSVSSKVLNENMLTRFREGSYYQGLKDGFSSLHGYANQVGWEIDFPSYGDIPQGDSTTLGKIVRFHGKSIAQRPASTNLNQQFDPSYNFQVQTITGDVVNIRFSQYMLDLVERVHAWNDGYIYGRIVETSSMEVNLLGIEEL